MIPPTVTFVSIDFTNESLPERLQSAGFDATQPAYFSWLGVVPYLELREITETLAFIASLPSGTAVTFDYGSDPSSLSQAGRVVFERMAAAVAAAGEPWKTFFTPDDLNDLLRSVGFSTIEVHGREKLNARYFAGRTDGLRVGEMTRLALAVV